jgi:hypothetical protein
MKYDVIVLVLCLFNYSREDLPVHCVKYDVILFYKDCRNVGN